MDTSLGEFLLQMAQIDARMFAKFPEYFTLWHLRVQQSEEEKLFQAISKQLELVESEQDEHAAEIRRLLDVQTNRPQPEL